MANFFDVFPKIQYDIDGKRLTKLKIVTDVFFRLRIIREALSNVSAYYEYLVSDDETPEILAERVYDDPEAHWIILMANDIIDPQYDWPLGSNEFKKYIIAKYGSIENAQTTYHHYEKVISREDSYTGTVTLTRFVINKEKVSLNNLDVPYDVYDDLPEEQEVNVYNIGNGKIVTEIINRNDISNYDYENELNEKKRAIKIIKPEYYPQIIREFNALVDNKASYIRRLV